MSAAPLLGVALAFGAAARLRRVAGGAQTERGHHDARGAPGRRRGGRRTTGAQARPPTADPALAIRDVADVAVRRRLVVVTRDGPTAPAVDAFLAAVTDQGGPPQSRLSVRALALRAAASTRATSPAPGVPEHSGSRHPHPDRAMTLRADEQIM